MHQIIKHLQAHCVTIEAWLRKQWQNHPLPIYGSVDLRNAGFKLAPVDTNLFPAGFNNLNPESMPLCIQAMQATIAEICPQVTRLLLIPENHTRNPYYFENLAMLCKIIRQSGFEVRLGSFNPDLQKPEIYPVSSGGELLIEPLLRQGDVVGVENFFPCCILLNNDLSGEIPDILLNLKQVILPPLELGWAKRLKSQHFHCYQQVTDEFAEEIAMDPWLITPYFDQCPEVDFRHKEGQQCLYQRARALFERIRKKYAEYQIEEKPFLVIKADQGTYGMAVQMIDDPEQLLTLNHRQRTQLSMAKGGVKVTRVLLQEGVHTFETVGEKDKQAVAEPVIYTIGRHVVGGFYRVHQERGPRENLNAPGMNFSPIAFQKPCHLVCSEKDNDDNNTYYAYGVIARLALLAAARESSAVSSSKV